MQTSVAHSGPDCSLNTITPLNGAIYTSASRLFTTDVLLLGAFHEPTDRPNTYIQITASFSVSGGVVPSWVTAEPMLLLGARTDITVTTAPVRLLMQQPGVVYTFDYDSSMVRGAGDGLGMMCVCLCRGVRGSTSSE